MKIMSERQFQAELAKAKEEIYQREQAEKRIMEVYHQLDAIQRDLLDLRRKFEGLSEKRATTTEVQE